MSTLEFAVSDATHRGPGPAMNESMPEGERLVLEQVERIMQSKELLDCDILRRLLRFLAEQSLHCPASELKEYSVAVDGLGKPSSYDPRYNSAVRIQVGRLREKLASYYRHEGQQDPVVIDVPKGHFKLTFEFRVKTALAQPALSGKVAGLAIPAGSGRGRGIMYLCLAVAVGAILALGTQAIFRLMNPVKAQAITSVPAWTPDLDALWGSFLANRHPFIVAVEDPLFARMDGKRNIYVRDKSLNTWQEIITSADVASMGAAVGSHGMEPTHFYAAFSELEASFLLAKTLANRVQNFSVLRTSDFSTPLLSEDNIIFLGNLQFTGQIQNSATGTALQQARDGIRNSDPGPNEPAIFADRVNPGGPLEEGPAYALITRQPGPLGQTEIVSFSSTSAPAYFAAVRAFTDPATAGNLVAHLKQANAGQMPRYYQILLKVNVKAKEATDASFVLARVLRARNGS